MPQFRKTALIDAVKVTAADYNGTMWDGSPFSHAEPWLWEALDKGVLKPHTRNHTDYAEWDIVTLEGVMSCGPGDWIARGVKGELWAIKGDVFDATYSRVSSEGDTSNG